jgi:hypothetical protein
MTIIDRIARRIARKLFKFQTEQVDMVAVAEQLRKSLGGLPVQVGYPHPYHDLNTNLGVITLMMISEYLEKHLYSNEKYLKSKRITHHAKKFYSMAGEDGLIREICHRIGIEGGQFVEFGVAYDGLENNTLYLLHKGWKGLWIEASSTIQKAAIESFHHHVQSGQLVIINDRVSAENIESLLFQANISPDFDVLSIDIDGNDYWVWKAITNYRPKVVIVEFNSVLGDEVACVMPYDPKHNWTGSYYMGASLKALEKLAAQKGYCLVGCDFQGVNSYFVRSDLVSDKFESPFSTENHYEPLRVFLTRSGGSLQGYGRFEQV